LGVSAKNFYPPSTSPQIPIFCITNAVFARDGRIAFLPDTGFGYLTPKIQPDPDLAMAKLAKIQVLYETGHRELNFIVNI